MRTARSHSWALIVTSLVIVGVAAAIWRTKLLRWTLLGLGAGALLTELVA